MTLPRRNHQQDDHADGIRSNISMNPFGESSSGDDGQNDDYQTGGFNQDDLISMSPPDDSDVDDEDHNDGQRAFTVPPTSRNEDSDNGADREAESREPEPPSGKDQLSGENGGRGAFNVLGRHSVVKKNKNKDTASAKFGHVTISKTTPRDQSSRSGDSVIIGAILGLVSVPAFLLFILITVLLLSKNLQLSFEVTGVIVLLFPVIGLILGALDMAKVKKATALGLVAVLTSLLSLGTFGYTYMQRGLIVQYVQTGIQNAVSSVMTGGLSAQGATRGSGSTPEASSSGYTGGNSTGSSGSNQGSGGETSNRKSDSAQSPTEDPVFDQIQGV